MKNQALIVQSYSAHLLMEEKILHKKSELVSLLQQIAEKYMSKIKITKLKFYFIVSINIYLVSFAITGYMWGILYALVVLVSCILTTALLLWILQKFEDYFPFKE